MNPSEKYLSYVPKILQVLERTCKQAVNPSIVTPPFSSHSVGVPAPDAAVHLRPVLHLRVEGGKTGEIEVHGGPHPGAGEAREEQPRGQGRARLRAEHGAAERERGGAGADGRVLRRISRGLLGNMMINKSNDSMYKFCIVIISCAVH